MCYSHSCSHMVSASSSARYTAMRQTHGRWRGRRGRPQGWAGSQRQMSLRSATAMMQSDGTHLRRPGAQSCSRTLQIDLARLQPRSALLTTGMRLWETASLNKRGKGVFQVASLSLARRFFGPDQPTPSVRCRLPGVLAPVPTHTRVPPGSSPLELGKTKAFSAVRLLSCRKPGSGEPHATAPSISLGLP